MKCLPSSNVKLILKNANARYTVTFLQFFCALPKTKYARQLMGVEKSRQGHVASVPPQKGTLDDAVFII